MTKVELGEGWEIIPLEKQGEEDPNYEYMVLRRKKYHVRWVISHPGLSYLKECSSFEECMEKWFEGFNIPYKIENNVQEPFELAHKRVAEWIAKKNK